MKGRNKKKKSVVIPPLTQGLAKVQKHTYTCHNQSIGDLPGEWSQKQRDCQQCFECWQMSKQITKCILILCQKAERTSREHLILTDIQIQKQRFSMRWERQTMPPSLSPSFSEIILIHAAVTRGQQEIIINNPQPTRNHGITELIYRCASVWVSDRFLASSEDQFTTSSQRTNQ